MHLHSSLAFIPSSMTLVMFNVLLNDHYVFAYICICLFLRYRLHMHVQRKHLHARVRSFVRSSSGVLISHFTMALPEQRRLSKHRLNP
jgi:hypothetical protein